MGNLLEDEIKILMKPMIVKTLNDKHIISNLRPKKSQNLKKEYKLTKYRIRNC